MRRVAGAERMGLLMIQTWVYWQKLGIHTANFRLQDASSHIQRHLHKNPAYQSRKRIGLDQKPMDLINTIVDVGAWAASCPGPHGYPPTNISVCHGHSTSFWRGKSSINGPPDHLYRSYVQLPCWRILVDQIPILNSAQCSCLGQETCWTIGHLEWWGLTIDRQLQ